jgi:hypothetical protein
MLQIEETSARARRSVAAAVIAALLGSATAPAHAQMPGKGATPGKSAPAAKGDAASSSGAPAVDPAKLEQAKQHMAAGSAFYNDPSGHKCEEALVEFGKAYELSGSWKALRAMGICELELERDGDAIVHFEEVLRLAGTQLAGADRTQIETDLRALKSAVATLTLRVEPPAARLVATRTPSSGLPKTNRYTLRDGTLKLGIHPGQYSFTVSAEGFSDATWQAEITNGSAVDKSVTLTPPVAATAPSPATTQAPSSAKTSAEEPERPVPIAVWILGGTAVASGIASGVFMGLSTVAKSDYDDVNGTGTVPASELESMRSDVVTKSLVADVLLGTSLATAGAAVLLYVLRPEESPSSAASVRVGPSFSHEGGGLFVSGTY